MARINEPFDVLVVSESTLLEKDKHAHDLTKGKLGIFDLKTGKSLGLKNQVASTVVSGSSQQDVDFDSTFGLNGVRFGVGLSNGDFLLSGATGKSQLDYVSYQKHEAAQELVITIDPKKDFEEDTTYAFSVEIADQSTYQTIGYNRLRKYFSIKTDDNLGNVGDTKKKVIPEFVKHINANAGGWFEAKADESEDNPTKIKLTFKSTYGNGILDAKVTLIEGWDNTATAKPATTPAKAAQGSGKLVRELEAASQGYRGNIYRVSTIWGLANDDIKLEAKEDKNYHLITIGYVNEIQTSGFRGKEPYTVILAIEDNGVWTGLKPLLRTAAELYDLIPEN